MNYSPEYKDSILRRILPPNNESITKIAREEGLSEQTIRNWQNKARKEGYAAPGKDAVPDDWSTQDKFLIVVETASLNETELAEYARKKGLYVEQIKAWKDACMNANGGIAKEAARQEADHKPKKTIHKQFLSCNRGYRGSPLSCCRLSPNGDACGYNADRSPAGRTWLDASRKENTALTAPRSFLLFS